MKVKFKVQTQKTMNLSSMDYGTMFEVPEYEILLSLFANVFFCRVRIIVCGRPILSVLFPFKSFLKVRGLPRVRPSSSLVWLGLATHRMEAFCWLVISSKVSMADNLRRRGFVLEEPSECCALFKREKENIDHLFCQFWVCSFPLVFLLGEMWYLLVQCLGRWRWCLRLGGRFLSLGVGRSCGGYSR